MEIRLGAEWVAAQLPKRPQNAHKGQLGTLTILAGSARYRGAAALATEGALRAGAGVVRLCATEAVCAAVAARQPCCTFLPQQATKGGTLRADALADALATPPSALLAGCGLGNTADIAQLVEELLRKAPCPLVRDADALNVMAGQLEGGPSEELRRRCLAVLDVALVPVVLTPHIGEMARLTGLSHGFVAANQLATALDFAAAHRCVTVVKSHVTVVATPAGNAYINDKAGNPGMAKAGSGDVLAGVIASLLCQGLTAEQAAACGVLLHAEAGDALAEHWGFAGLSPADLPAAVARRLMALGR